MDSIEQLKAMRDAARDRIEALPDYKLMTKLTTLIEELEEIFTAEGGAAPAAGEELAEGEAEEEADRGTAATEPVEGGHLRQGLHKWKSTLAQPPSVDAALESEIAEGLAQLEIEETPVTSPTEEIGEELAAEAEPAMAAEEEVAEPAQESAEETAARAGEEVSEDADTALKQAMAELEADLGSVDLKNDPSRFRYGNSS